MFCGKCGTENAEGSRFCAGCGEPLDGGYYQTENKITAHCPRCKSRRVQLITKTEAAGGGYGWCKGCLGYALLGPFGLLCGLCGREVFTTNKTVFACMECGKEFLPLDEMITKKENDIWIRRAGGVAVSILTIIVVIVYFFDGEILQGLGTLVVGGLLAVGLGVISYEDAQKQCEDVKKNGYDSEAYLKK